MRAVTALLVVAFVAAPAFAGDLCAREHRRDRAAKPIDLDLEHAELGDVLRLLADAGKVNLVVGDDVSGKVTLHLRHVAWEQAACAIAATHALALDLDGTILLVRPVSATKR